jgi:hypothetical protein
MLRNWRVLFDAMSAAPKKVAADADRPTSQLNGGRVDPGGRFVRRGMEDADQPLIWARCALEPTGPSAISTMVSLAPTWLVARLLRQSVTSCETSR